MSSLVQPAAVVALDERAPARRDEALSRKLNATTVNVTGRRLDGGVARSRFGPTERRVLGLLTAASRDARRRRPGRRAGDEPARTRGRAGSPCSAAPASSSPSYADMFSEGGDWRAGMLRRGTPDPQRSLVVVPTTTFANAAGAAAMPRPRGGRRPSATTRGSARRRSRSG